MDFTSLSDEFQPSECRRSREEAHRLSSFFFSFFFHSLSLFIFFIFYFCSSPPFALISLISMGLTHGSHHAMCHPHGFAHAICHPHGFDHAMCHLHGLHHAMCHPLIWIPFCLEKCGNSDYFGIRRNSSG